MNSLSNSYSTYGISTLTNPNPANSLKGGVTKITPLYIKLYGNYTVSNTALNAIYQEYNTKITASVNLMSQAQQYSSYINTYMNDIKSTLASIQSNVATFTSAFSQINTTVIDNWVTAQNRVNDNGVTAFLALFAILVGLAGLSTLCLVFFTTCCKVQCLRFVLHLVWNLITIIMILTFILGGVFGLIGLVGVDGVPVMKWIFGTQNLQSSSPKIITSTTTASYINTCINGNGDLSKVFIPSGSYANYLDQLYQVSYTLSTTQATITANQHSIAIAQLNSYYNNTMNDITASTDKTLGNNDISSILTELRGWSDASLGKYSNGCSPAPKDVFVQNSALCPSGYAYAANGGTLGSQNCAAFTQFTGTTASQRYSGLTGCAASGSSDFTSVASAVSAYTTALNQYVSDNNALLNQLVANNNNLDQSFVQSAQKLSNSLTQIKGVIDPLFQLFQNIVGNQGLFSLINCGKNILTLSLHGN